MSPPTSSSSHPPRTPLQERSFSENNQLSIRVVPYSPPRPETQDGENSVAEDQDNLPVSPSETAHPSPIKSQTGSEVSSLHPGSSLPSPSSSTVSLGRGRRQVRGVSEWTSATELYGRGPSTPPIPVTRRSFSFGSQSSGRLITPSQPSAPRRRDSSSSARSRPQSQGRRVITVHADKTFSVQLQPTGRISDQTASSARSRPFSNFSTTISSQEPSAFDLESAIEDPPSSPLTSVAQGSPPPSTPFRSTGAPDDFSSPWNYQLVGGLRKVAKTPDLKQAKGKEKEVTPTPSLPPLPETIVSAPEPARLAAQSSFDSGSSNWASEEGANYQVVGHSSPVFQKTESIGPPSSVGDANYKLYGPSSPIQPFTPSGYSAVLDTPGSRNLVIHDATSPYSPSTEPPIVDTPGSQNFVVHRGLSPASSFATFPRQPRLRYSDDSLADHVREQYSHESLAVRPLDLRRQSSYERFGYHNKLSRESLRGRTNSFSSISSVISQDTASLFLASQNIHRLGHARSNSSLKRASWAGSTSGGQHRNRMDAHPHQWSSQLSTVMSEYEGSEGGSRVLSMGSMGERLSSNPGSRGSRQMLDLSSLPVSPVTPALPSPAFMTGGREPAIWDEDEHGDGLADLQHQLQHKSSWTRVGGYLVRRASDRELHSSASATSIPAWARLYYGSGERRWLAHQPSISTMSESGEESVAGYSWANESPAPEQYSGQIFNPRRRPKTPKTSKPPKTPTKSPKTPKDKTPKDKTPKDTKAGKQVVRRPSSVFQEATQLGIGELRRYPKKMTSSVWSPHLQTDRRASTYSMWDPPSIAWSAESGMFGRRNIQVVLFVLGFLMPFAWMIAAFLPLPPKPFFEMLERDTSNSTGLGIAPQTELFHRPPPGIDEYRYQAARWWRNLNRFMSVIGLLILGAIAALVAVSLT